MGSKAATFVILAIYIAIMVGIGIYMSKRTKSSEDFMLGGRSVGSWLTAFSYGTTYFSAVVFIGYAGQFGWMYGASATWVGIGNAIIGSLIPFFLLGKRTRLMTNHLGAKTMPEYFEHRFDSTKLKTASALIVFIFLIPYTASVYNGLSRLFGMVFDLGENGGTYIIIAMAILSAVYVTLGGYKATALNDFFQGIIMLIGIGTVVALTVQKKDGLSAALDALNSISDSKTETGTLGSMFGPDPINLLGVVLLTSLGTWGLPQMVQKFYAIKDEQAIKKGAIISTFFAIVVAGGSYFMGGFVRLYCTLDGSDGSGRTLINTVDGKPVYDTMVPALIHQALPNLLIGLVVVLVLSASLSTLSSLVLTSSSTLTNDLIKPRVKNFDDKKQVTFMRGFIAVFLVISVIIACNKNASISTLMSYSWGALSGAFLGPFLYGLFMKKASKAACWTSFITGVGISVAHMLIFSLNIEAFSGIKQAVIDMNCPLNLLSPINAGAFAMIISLIIVPIISSFTKAPDEKIVDNAFSSLNTAK
ncbi:sodium:solute symporter family protein [Ruminococcus flavefaciens]|uniref:sodium:solute symporter family protein n=1 Tax=Ruminococcus flavefaciens TaxID=1265 RepID=UPI0026F1A338|nr:sodium:solute symporter family protein [Ruminococcus flavefaciens]MDD7515823.1 sodium:solute symporter family protein [Ruminococcus flavefaciens]MDY5693106.1 sodium:solute symporter family protein [Ruminococcus flavefaciens]